MKERAPVTLKEAQRSFDEATTEDAALGLFFAFTQEHLGYAALFVVRGDSAEARHAFGNGVARDRVLALRVPLDTPSVLSRAILDASALRADSIFTAVETILRSESGWPARVPLMAIPVTLGSRIVALLCGGSRSREIDPGDEARVRRLAEIAGQALERIGAT